MKRGTKAFFAALLAGLFLLSALGGAAAAQSVPAPVLKSSQSVVRILAETEEYIYTGSGFVISSHADATLIATNYHVVEGNPYLISVWADENKTVDAKILAYSEQKDLCILVLQSPLPLPALKLSANSVKQGDAVFAVGFPSAADYLAEAEAHTSSDATITDGIVSAVRQMAVVDYGISVPLLQINAALNAGNSGGPLFNARGEVVGINTYSMYDSQGIFGAIAVEELLTLARDNGITLKGPAVQWDFLVYILLAAALALFIIGIVKLVGKGRKAPRNAAKKARKRMRKQPAVPLPAYLEAIGGPLGFERAVSLLMPVALELKNLHEQGRAYLKLAPGNIAVRETASLLGDAANDCMTAIFSGFTPPEIYRDRNSGHRSDIYSFCALLAYASAGRAPLNALERQESPDAPVFLPPFDEQLEPEHRDILDKGMALEPRDRYATMQELIYELTPYNVPACPASPSVERDSIERYYEAATPGGETARLAVSPARERAAAPAPQKPAGARRKLSAKAQKALLAACGICVVLAVLLGGFALIVRMDYDHYALGEDSRIPLVNEHLYNNYNLALEKYFCAKMLFDNGKYNLAASVFARIDPYLDSGAFYMESQYRYAAQAADANNFYTAVNLYRQLAAKDYKDAAQLVNDTRYRHAAYKLYSLKDFEAAYEMANELESLNHERAGEFYNAVLYEWGRDHLDKEEYFKAYEKLSRIPEYGDALELLVALKEAIYTQAQDDYRNKRYERAWDAFSLLKPYRSSAEYLTLIYNVNDTVIDPDHLWFVRLYRHTHKMDWIKPYEGSDYDALIRIFWLDDASRVILGNIVVSLEYLGGKWKTADGRYYFTMNSNGGISYNLPLPSYGRHYTIEYATMKFFSDWSKKKDACTFKILSSDSVNIYCYKNSKTYTLYRQ